MTPTQRTLRELKRRGLVCAIVEKWNAHARLRQDLFGIIDIIALDVTRGVVGVQSAGNDFAGHHRKLTQEKAQECRQWLETPGAHLELWAWRKVAYKRGGALKLWKPRIRVYTLKDFEGRDPLAE